MRKIITGFTVQTYDDDGKCLRQEFIAGEVEYEDDESKPIEMPIDYEYQMMDMVQPAAVLPEPPVYQEGNQGGLDADFRESQFDYACRLFVTHANMYGFFKNSTNEDVPTIVAVMKNALKPWRWLPDRK